MVQVVANIWKFSDIKLIPKHLVLYERPPGLIISFLCGLWPGRVNFKFLDANTKIIWSGEITGKLGVSTKLDEYFPSEQMSRLGEVDHLMMMPGHHGGAIGVFGT